jgi:hypothetical protein
MYLATQHLVTNNDTASGMDHPLASFLCHIRGWDDQATARSRVVQVVWQRAREMSRKLIDT